MHPTIQPQYNVIVTQRKGMLLHYTDFIQINGTSHHEARKMYTSFHKGLDPESLWFTSQKGHLTTPVCLV